jgi:predicted transcriptional regulator YdeE
MKETILFKENFQLMGISERTSNAEEMKGNGKIPMLWQRFYSEGIIQKLNSICNFIRNHRSLY